MLLLLAQIFIYEPISSEVTLAWLYRLYPVVWVFQFFYNCVGLHLALSVNYWAQVMRTRGRTLIVLHNISREQERRIRIQRDKVFSDRDRRA